MAFLEGEAFTNIGMWNIQNFFCGDEGVYIIYQKASIMLLM
jgi:hypothetical protein